MSTPTEKLEHLIQAAEEMDGHFGEFMDGLREGGSAWNAADSRRAQMHSAIRGAREALAKPKKEEGHAN